MLSSSAAAAAGERAAVVTERLRRRQTMTKIKRETHTIVAGLVGTKSAAQTAD
jgi:hypothetical protein